MHLRTLTMYEQCSAQLAQAMRPTLVINQLMRLHTGLQRYLRIVQLCQ